MLSILALAAALALASLWGMAAGSESGALMVANAYKVPMVILLSALTALPAGIVTLRLSNARLGGADLAGAFATSIFGGTLVLATLAPLVAIYYHTSSKAGLPLALGSVFVALATASLLFARAVARRVSDRKSLFAVGVLVVIFLARRCCSSSRSRHRSSAPTAPPSTAASTGCSDARARIARVEPVSRRHIPRSLRCRALAFRRGVLRGGASASRDVLRDPRHAAGDPRPRRS